MKKLYRIIALLLALLTLAGQGPLPAFAADPPENPLPVSEEDGLSQDEEESPYAEPTPVVRLQFLTDARFHTNNLRIENGEIKYYDTGKVYLLDPFGNRITGNIVNKIKLTDDVYLFEKSNGKCAFSRGYNQAPFTDYDLYGASREGEFLIAVSKVNRYTGEPTAYRYFDLHGKAMSFSWLPGGYRPEYLTPDGITLASRKSGDLRVYQLFDRSGNALLRKDYETLRRGESDYLEEPPFFTYRADNKRYLLDFDGSFYNGGNPYRICVLLPDCAVYASAITDFPYSYNIYGDYSIENRAHEIVGTFQGYIEKILDNRLIIYRSLEMKYGVISTDGEICIEPAFDSYRIWDPEDYPTYCGFPEGDMVLLRKDDHSVVVHSRNGMVFDGTQTTAECRVQKNEFFIFYENDPTEVYDPAGRLWFTVPKGQEFCVVSGLIFYKMYNTPYGNNWFQVDETGRQMHSWPCGYPLETGIKGLASILLGEDFSGQLSYYLINAAGEILNETPFIFNPKMVSPFNPDAEPYMKYVYSPKKTGICRAVYPWDSPFADVLKTDWFREAVDWAVEAGVTSGTSDCSFSPNAACTRGQVVTFLWRAEGCPEPVADGSPAQNPFSDVSADAYYFEAVQWAVANSVTTGTDRTHFSPDAKCTRGQVVTFLWRAEGCPEPAADGSPVQNPFSDVHKGDYFCQAVLWAVANGVTAGTDKTHFSPSDKCTRAQVVTFLWRTSRLPAPASPEPV